MKEMGRKKKPIFRLVEIVEPLSITPRYDLAYHAAYILSWGTMSYPHTKIATHHRIRILSIV